MMNFRILAVAVAVLLPTWLAGSALAADHTAHKHAAPMNAAQPADPQAAIPEVMKALLGTQDNPLTVQPVVVAGDWAIAGWLQGDKGGRALLKHGDKGWAIHLCSGASLKDAKALMQIGVEENQAQTLAADLNQAEAALGPKQIALYDSFEGTMLMQQ